MPRRKPTTQVNGSGRTKHDAQAPQPAGKPEPKRLVNRRWFSDDCAYMVLRVATADDDACYFVQRMPGDVYTMQKLVPGGATYHVLCGIHSGAGCNCKGFTTRKTCKHVDALNALAEAGKL
jgi:hypothetical protein